MGKQCLSVYEDGSLAQVTGATLRPGGLELTKRALSYCQFPVGARVLDIGCGTGETVRFLVEACGLEALGIDASPVMIQKGQERYPDLPIEEGRGDDLPCADCSLHGVLMECTFGLIDDKDALLKEVFRVLRPGGKLIITDIYYRNRQDSIQTKDGILALLDRYGFKVLVWEDHSGYLVQLVVDSIMKHGTADTLWTCLLNKKENRGACCKEIKGWKPGYFLLVAEKKSS
ncbi:MAG TPA: class I SAM-dependent methyltransferase [Clostridia bacterium]|nr:class I SAM-dependent methyltransferase [Clostridia bacterium]